MSVCESFPFQDVYCILPLGHTEDHHYRSHHDHDWYKAIGGAQFQIEKGNKVYQKFTCRHCGNRLTIEEANVFHTLGECDRCGGITDIMENGHNYLLVMNMRKRK